MSTDSLDNSDQMDSMETTSADHIASVVELFETFDERLTVIENRVSDLEDRVDEQNEEISEITDTYGLVEGCEEELNDLSKEVDALSSIFRTSHVKKARAHVQARDSNENGQVSPSDIVHIAIDDPPGEGEDPSKGVGRVNGKVTFVDPNGVDFANDLIKAEIKDVKETVNTAVAVEKVN